MQKYNNRLVSATSMLNKAKQHKYAVGHFNINNLEWTKAILEVAQSTNTPIIIGVSEGAIKYMGGFNTVANMVNGLLEDLNITIPIALHLDHGQTIESVKKAIDAGFSSVMYDGSHRTFEENIENTKIVLEYAQKHEVSVETEIGSIGGEEDGVIGNGELGNPEEAKIMAKTGINFLAAGIGNIHGEYPSNWKSLSFDTLKELSEASNLPMVLHGGSGIPQEQVKKAISLGISKINVNTELQIAFCKGLRNYFDNNKDKEHKGFDPRKILKVGSEEIKTTFKELTSWFGSQNKA